MIDPEKKFESNHDSSAGSQIYNGQPDDLHDLFVTSPQGGTDEEDPLAALRNDPNYSALIRDLEYIAKQAVCSSNLQKRRPAMRFGTRSRRV